jgi:hypothetical protein
MYNERKWGGVAALILAVEQRFEFLLQMASLAVGFGCLEGIHSRAVE